MVEVCCFCKDQILLSQSPAQLSVAADPAQLPMYLQNRSPALFPK